MRHNFASSGESFENVVSIAWCCCVVWTLSLVKIFKQLIFPTPIARPSPPKTHPISGQKPGSMTTRRSNKHPRNAQNRCVERDIGDTSAMTRLILPFWQSHAECGKGVTFWSGDLSVPIKNVAFATRLTSTSHRSPLIKCRSCHVLKKTLRQSRLLCKLASLATLYCF